MSVIGKSGTIRRTAPWVITLAFVWPAGALAQQKSKHGEAEVQAVQTSRTKIEKSTGQAIIKQPKIDTNYIVRNVQTKMAKINDQLIGKLQRLIRITDDTDAEKPDLMFRLAELFAEKQRFYTFRAGEMDEKIAAAGRDAYRKRQLQSEKKGFEDQERYWLLEAVKIYIEIVNAPKFKKYPKMDEVLFYLAYMLQQVRREEQARVFFQRLIKDHPSSKFIPDAYMSFGVYYFQTGDMDSARKIFDRVTQFKQSRVYGYAMYLKAWCWYNLSQYKRSLETFEQVIEIARAQRKTNKLAPTLERDSKINMVLPYSRVEPIEVGASKAWNYFRRYGGDVAPKMHERLAEVYWEQGRYKLSTQIYHELMRNFPASQSFCNWQYSIVRNTISTGNLRDQVQELQRLSAVWEYAREKKFLKPDKFEECEQNTQAMLHELATVWHKTGQKTENVTYYDLAQHLYKEYITKFPRSKDAPLMTYYYGDLLFMLATKSGDAKKWQEAAEVFTRAVKSDSAGKIKVKTRDGTKVMRNEAAFAAVFCWMKALKLEEEVSGADERESIRKEEARKKGQKKGKQKEEDLYKPQPVPKKQLLMLDAFETYLRLVPKAPERIRIHYQKARIFYEVNQFDKAAPIFAEIATQYKTDPLAVVAANLLLNCLEHQKKFNEIATWVDRFLGAPELTKDAEFKKVLDTIKAGIEWKKCEEFEAKKEYKAAGICQNDLVDKYGTDPRVPTLLHDMGVNFTRAKLIGNAMKARQALVDWATGECKKGNTKACKHPLAQKAQFQLGQSYMELAFFESAAKYFENFAEKYGGEKEAPQALSTAVFFRRGLGQDAKAIEDSRDFVKFYGRGGKHAKPQEAAAVEFSIGQIYETQKNWDRLVKHYTQYLKEWAKHGGVDREILAHVKIGEVQWRQSCPVAGVNGACIDVKRVSAGGKASFVKAAKGKKARVKGRTQCGPETKSKITVHARKPAVAKAAQGHFATAIRLFGTSKGKVGGKDPQDKAIREAEMMYAVAQAKLMQVEASYEKFLAMQVPTGLDFDTDPKKKKKLEESTKKFTKWFEDKSKTLGKLSEEYQSVITLKQAHWAIAALARIGQLYQNYADQLYTVEIPKAPKAPPGIKQEEFAEMFAEKYCDAMVDQVEKWKLVPKASEGFGKCLNKSTELFWYNEWSALCEQELNQLDPRSFPMAVEIRAQPGYVEAKVEPANVSLDVKD